MNSDGSGLRELAESEASDWGANWAPSGDAIAFVSDREGNREIYATNLADSGLVKLTNNPSDDWFPIWSPDGLQLAFLSDRDGDDDIFVMGADGSKPVNLTRELPRCTWLTWSPTDDLIAFISGGDLWIMHADSSAQRCLMDDAAIEMHPTWSPDGRNIAFASNPDGGYDIFVIDVNGLALTRLTQTNWDDMCPVWSSR